VENKIKVLVFIGSRSNYGRLHQLILGLQETYDVSICLACTAVGLHLPIYIEKLIKQVIRADMLTDTLDNMTTTMSLVAIQVQNHLVNNTYDLAICHGDRFETLGFAVACSFSDLPLVHMEAGEYSGNIDDKIRWAITSLASLHLAPTINAMSNLGGRTGGRTRPVFVGSPAVEYVLRNKNCFKKRKVEDYILVVYNPTDSGELNILLEFLEIIREMDIHWINPNIDPGNKHIARMIHIFTERDKRVTFFKNLPLDEYLTEMANCQFIIGNSSSGIKEAAALEKQYFLFPNRQANREMDKNVTVVKTLDDVLEAYEDFVDGKYCFEYTGLFGNKDVTAKCLLAIDRFLRSDFDGRTDTLPKRQQKSTGKSFN
jgi:GDP/UDP-N,N'-diacetylbacillosamine 2-epimerase (hydrolysing)